MNLLPLLKSVYIENYHIHMRNCLFLILTLTLISSCESTEKQTSNGVKFISYEDELFSISFPSDWINATDKYGNFNFAVVAPQDTKTDVVPENVTVLIQDIGDTINLEQFKDLTEDQLGQYMPDYVMINKEIVKENGKDCLHLEYQASQNNTKKRYLQRTYIYSGKVYVVTFIAEDIIYKEYSETADKILDSFHPKK